MDESVAAYASPAADIVMRALRWSALVVVLVPFAVLIVALVHAGGHFHAVSDQALEEIQTRDVGRHFVQIGPYSRDNWSHPGPAMFYVLAIPYWLAGGNSIGLWIGAALLNGAAIAAMAAIARRHGGTSLMLMTLLGNACLMRTLGPDFLREPWNPYLPVFMFGALVFLVWAMACGDIWAVPVAAAVATFCAQTHIGYVILALPLFLGGAIWLAVSVRAEARRSLTRALWITAAVVVLMWLPPIWDEFTRAEGNLTRIVRYFQHPPPGPHYTMIHGFRLVASQFSLLPEWLRRVPKQRPFTAEPLTLFHSPAPWLLVAFVAAGVVLFRSRQGAGRYDSRAWRLAVIVGAAVMLGIISVARTIGVAFAYRLHWALVLGMVGSVVTIWTAWRFAAPRLPHWARHAFTILAVLLIVAVATVDTVIAATIASPQRGGSRNVAILGEQTRSKLPLRAGDVTVFSPDPLTGYQPGLILWLERHGVAARVLPFEALAYGSPHVHAGQPLRAALTVASGAEAKRIAALPGEEIIAVVGSASSDELRRVVAQSEALNREYVAGQIDDREFGARGASLLAQIPFMTAVFLQGPTAVTSPRRQGPR